MSTEYNTGQTTITTREKAEALFQKYQRWALRLALYRYRKMQKHQPTLLDDLENAALLGLWNASLAYEQARHVRFERYAAIKVHGAMLDRLRDLDDIGRSQRMAEKKSGQFTRVVPVSFQANPRDGLTESGREVSALDLKMQYMVTTPTDRELEDRDEIERILRNFKPRKRQVFWLLYEGFNQKEIAEKLSMSASRISQIVSEIIPQMQEIYQRIQTEEDHGG